PARGGVRRGSHPDARTTGRARSRAPGVRSRRATGPDAQAPPSSERRQGVMRSLAEAAVEAADCVRCRLSETRTQVVFGVGNPEADLMFIGEAPGFHEDRQGEP